MKLKINFFDPKVFEEKLDHLKDIDFTLFVDEIPRVQSDLSSINIIALQEPNEYFQLHDWVIKNQHLFSFILTWDDKVLNTCENAMYLPFGHTWFKPNQYETPKLKKFEVSHLCGKLNRTYGHGLRHELLERKDEISIPTNFYHTYGDRNNIEDARLGKEKIFGFSEFGVAIENVCHRGYFSEKILDCFLMRTIPFYWGCSNIDQFFNTDGIIKFNNIDDLIYIANQLDQNYYKSKEKVIKENWIKAQEYVDYEQNIANRIDEVFKLNNII